MIVGECGVKGELGLSYACRQKSYASTDNDLQTLSFHESYLLSVLAVNTCETQVCFEKSIKVPAVPKRSAFL